jgi:hypothetical protein
MNYKKLYDLLITNGGFTCGWNGLNLIDKGIIVSITDNKAEVPENYRDFESLIASVLSRKEYRKYIGDSNFCWGCWISGEGILYIDINRVFDDLHSALCEAVLYGQKAIFDLENKQLYTLPSPQRTGTETQKRNYSIKIADCISQKKYYINNGQIICKI